LSRSCRLPGKWPVLSELMATTLTEQNQEYIPKHWEEVPCPFCNSRSFRPHERFGPDHRYTYVQCRDCDLVYSNPRPRYDADFLEAAYSVYDVDNYHFKNGGALDAGERFRVDQLKITLRQIERALGRKGKILDVGSHTGLFLKGAKELGWDTLGIDISEKMTSEVSRCFGIPTFCGQYHETDLTSHGPFDAIYCSHVIEHIPNPIDWAAKFRRDLKSDGILCLNVPNQFSWDRCFKRGLKAVGLKKDKWELWRTPDHLYEPHLKPMTFLLERAGFEVIEAFTYSSREKESLSGLGQVMHGRFRAGTKLRILARPTKSH